MKFIHLYYIDYIVLNIRFQGLLSLCDVIQITRGNFDLKVFNSPNRSLVER